MGNKTGLAGNLRK